jgi:type II secretory pathway pseudopilin PulG
MTTSLHSFQHRCDDHGLPVAVESAPLSTRDGWRLIIRRTSLLLLFILLCMTTAVAIPLSAYRERIRKAVVALDSLQAIDEAMNARARAARLRSTLQEVRKTLPPAEAVEWDNRILNVDNKWLDEALAEFEKMPPDHPLRNDALTHITERLQALSEHLAEMQGQTSTSSASKDEEKARLATILRRKEYDTKKPEQSALAGLWERITNWLRDLLPEFRPIAPGSGSAISGVAQIVILLLALAVIVFVVWKFLPRFLKLKDRKRKKEKPEARVVLGEHLAPEETSADLLAEAEALARSGDIRAAIRKGYIALLCELHDRKVLRLEQHKTNLDYLRAISDNRTLYDEMRPLTTSFESHWYGFRPASTEDWAAFRSRYQQALKN